MSSSKKMYLKRDFAAGVYMSETQNPYPTAIHNAFLFLSDYI